jgi:protein phosphatase 1L
VEKEQEERSTKLIETRDEGRRKNRREGRGNHRLAGCVGDLCRLLSRAFKGGKDPSQMASDLQGAAVGGGQGHQNHHIVHGYSLVKGKSRHAMEDYHVAEFRIVNDHEVGLFAVYDGHLGHSVAVYLQHYLFDNILNEASFWTDPTEAIGQAYLTTDATILDNAPNLGPGGSTAVTAILIDGKDLLVANVGDSRAVLSKGGVAEQLSVDHEPGQPTERNNIETRGGFVSNIPGSVTS